MSLWVILIIIIAVFFIYELTVGKKERNQRAEQENEMFRRIRMSGQKKRDEELTRLDNGDEQQAQRIKKLFYSAAWHESRNVTAFHNILKELSQISKEILQMGGNEKMNIVMDRVEYLCGSDRKGFAEFISIMRRTYLEPNAVN